MQTTNLDIKQYLTENGIVNAVQSQLRDGLRYSSARGKAIDVQTAKEIKKIWDQDDREVAARKKKKIASMAGQGENKKSIDIGAKPITESLILTRKKYLMGGIAPTTVKGTAANGLKGVLDKDKGNLDVTLQQARANNGQQYGNRAAVKKTHIQEDASFGYVKPLPRKPSGKAIEAMNEKNITIKPASQIPSAFSILRENPTRVAKIGHKVNRDQMNQTNRNGEGVR